MARCVAAGSSASDGGNPGHDGHQHPKEKFTLSGDPGLIWEGHKAGREIGDCHLQKLHNLESLPPYGFTVVCFPVKIRGASAGWARAVAIL